MEKNEHINLFSSSSDPAVSWGVVCLEAENVHFCSLDTYIFTIITGGHLATEVGTSKSGGVQDSTISLQAAVHLRCKPWALMKEEEEEEEVSVRSTDH